MQELIIRKDLDEELLDHLLEFMPNVKTFEGMIGYCTLASAFPSLLKARKVFTILNLSDLSLSDEELIKLLKSCLEFARSLGGVLFSNQPVHKTAMLISTWMVT